MARILLQRVFPAGMILWFCTAMAPGAPPAEFNPADGNNPLVFDVHSGHQRLEMTVHTSRILSLGQKIPQMQVNNPEILELTPLSPTQIQVSAKATGVTQINLWGENQKVFTIDVMVHGDAQEMTMLLQTNFPNAALKITPFASTVLVSGFVEETEQIDKIMRIAEEYYPKPINNLRVGGVQQVLLHVKVMEVSRTKLRRLGFDWAQISGSNMIMSGVSGLLMTPSSPALPSGSGIITPAPPAAANNPVAGTMAFNVTNGNNAFFGVLDALRKDNLMKIMAEPTLVTINGRAANFHVGGEFAITVPQSLGTNSIEYKQYGMDIDFVPIVLGNGKIRLEVRPVVSEPDTSFVYSLGGAGTNPPPALKNRSADTAVELMAGQTFAIAGLVENRVEASVQGIPWVSEVPYLGAAFSTKHETVNEVEVLILVTPDLVGPMDACEVPTCGPGMATTSPNDWELFMYGHLEVPNCCPAPGGNCGPCTGPQGADGLQPPGDGMIGPEPVPSPEPAGTTRTAPSNNPQAAPGSPRTYSQPTPAVASRPNDRYSRANPHTSPRPKASDDPNEPPGFIGPIGYDVVK
jgi:pilus assembly protein CpaC